MPEDVSVLEDLQIIQVESYGDITADARVDGLRALRWMLGTWTAAGDDSVTTESWESASPGTFEGRGETRLRDTGALIHHETLRLVEMSGEVFYLAKVPHNDLPVAFLMVSCTDGHAVFENAGHDFPKRLEYRLVDEGMAVAVTDGAGEGFEVRFVRNGDGRR